MGVSGLTRTSTPEGTFATTFENGDAVGIFAVAEGATAYSNVKYTFDGTEWKSDAPIYAEDGVSYTYYAYYPYKEGVDSYSAAALSVLADQSTEANYNASDVLTSTTTATGTAVTLQYGHAYALVQVTLKGSEAGNGTVTLPALNLGGTTDLATGVTTIGGETGTITMMPFAANSGTVSEYKYRAIVPAQDVEANEPLVEIALNGKNYRYTYNAAVPYESGKYRQITITLGEQSGSPIVVGGAEDEIKNWEASTDVTGGGDVEEVIDYTVDEVTALTSTTLNSDAVYAALATDAADGWYGVSFDGATYDVTASDASGEWENMAVYTWDRTKNAGAWYRGSIAYNHVTPVDAEKIYKLTFKVKASATGDTSYKTVTVACLGKNSVENKRMPFEIANNAEGKSSSGENWADANGATMINTTLTNLDAWQDVELWINFKKCNNGGTLSGSANLVDATADDYSKIQLRFYHTASKTTEAATYTISVTDVKLEPVTE